MPAKTHVRAHDRAKPKSRKPAGELVTCGKCEGTGAGMAGFGICPVCKGVGKVRI